MSSTAKRSSMPKGNGRPARLNVKLPIDCVTLAKGFAAQFLPEAGDLAPTLELYRKSPRDGKRALVERTPQEFQGWEEYLDWAQLRALYQKSSSGGTPAQRKSAALAGFLADERKNKRTNKRLRHYLKHPNRMPDEMRVILSRARGFIRDTIGELTSGKLCRVVEFARPGKGTCIGTRDFSRVSVPFKLDPDHTEFCVTPRALPYARMMVETSPSWLSLSAEPRLWDASGREVFCVYEVPYVLSNASRVMTVPKDGAVDRTIAIEPHLNVALQLGVHDYIVKCLKRVGVDLTDQSSNQRGALVGASRWNLLDPLVTLDLRSASNSVTTELVRTLLPPSWFSLLFDLRVDVTDFDGSPHTLEMFSSMGNGFTFALESLIFWALARACGSLCNGTTYVAVFGDDIVVPRSHALLLVETLRFCGFSLNTDKSFIFGEFRESCGCDFWADQRVTPVYLREIDNLFEVDGYRLVNDIHPRYRGWVGSVLDAVFRKLRRSPIRVLVNEDSCSGWFTSFAEMWSRKLLKRHTETQHFSFKGLRFIPLSRKSDMRSRLAARLSGFNRRDYVSVTEEDPDVILGRVSKAMSFPVRGKGKWALTSFTQGRKVEGWWRMPGV